MGDLPTAEQPGAPWRDVLVIVALVALVGCPSLFTRDLWNPDEPRYMEVAREMVVLGDYVIPHVNGRVYRQKPPVWFWAAAVFWRLGAGFNSGRIVTLLAVTGALLLTYGFMRKEMGHQAGLLAAVIALTTLFLAQYAKKGVLDPLLVLFTTAALIAGYRALQRTALHPTRLWCLCYGAMALATLTKGPVGVLVPALILLTYGLIDRRNVRGGGKAHLVGLGVYVVCVGAWLLPAVIVGGQQYAQTILVKQNVGRMVDSWSHSNPVYFYLKELPWRFLPWSFLLALAIFSAWRLWRRKGDGLSLFALLWLVVPVVFFSLMSGKRGRYILPIVPAAGLLCGRYLILARQDGFRFPRAEKWLLGLGLAQTGLAAALLLAFIALTAFHVGVRELAFERAGAGAEEMAAHLTLQSVALGMALAAVPLIVAAFGLIACRRSSLRLAGALVASALALSVAFDLTVVPFLDSGESARRFGEETRFRAGKSGTVYLFGTEYSATYNLYAGYVRMPVLQTRDDLLKALAEHSALVIGDAERLAGVLRPSEIDRYTAYTESVGHSRMLLLAGTGSDGSSASPGVKGDVEPLR